RVEASAPGCLPFQRELILLPGEEVNVAVLLPPDPRTAQAVPPVTRDSTVPAAQPPSATAARDTAQPPPTSAAPALTGVSATSEKRPVGAGPYVVLGVGAASLGASAVFLILRNNQISKLDAQCSQADRSVCPDMAAAHSLQDKASTYNL